VPAAASAVALDEGVGLDEGYELGGYRSWLECLDGVPEPRRRHGVSHRLAVVLAFAVAAVPQ